MTWQHCESLQLCLGAALGYAEAPTQHQHTSHLSLLLLGTGVAVTEAVCLSILCDLKLQLVHAPVKADHCGSGAIRNLHKT